MYYTRIEIEAMNIIKNFKELAHTPERKIVLEIIEAGLAAIQPQEVIKKNVSLEGNTLKIQNQTFDLKNVRRIFLIGFGKGSAVNAKRIEEILGKKLNEGYVIDVTEENLPAGRHAFDRIHFTKGTHPLPSKENYHFTKQLITRFSGKLSQKDLVLVIICGGGSAMLVSPHHISLDQKIAVNKALLASGANIIEMNTVRKHLSNLKGGGLAKILYPAVVVSLIFSDVIGNDFSSIASGPTVKDNTTVEDAWNIIEKFRLERSLKLSKTDFTETPKKDSYFENIHNTLMLSNATALSAMRQKASEFKKYKSFIYSDKLQGEAKEAGPLLAQVIGHNQLLLAAGETTVTVTHKGIGGRNQELVLGALESISNHTAIAAIDSDGWDNAPFAGAIGDHHTLQKANKLKLNHKTYLKNNDSYSFFEKVKDGILTERLPSNVADLMVVLKK